MRHIFKITSALLILLPLGASADQIQYMAYPEQSLSAFATMIDGAKSTIDIATFIFQPCETSARVLTEKLAAKAKAGVRVRILVDALEQPLFQRINLANEMAKNGIQFRLYSNSLIDIDMRMHSKFMVVDGEEYIMGGRNFADAYFDLSPQLNYVDRDILVSGASVSVAQAGFNTIWNSDMASIDAGFPNQFQNWNDFCQANLRPAVQATDRYLAANASSILNSVPVRSCKVHFNIDNPDFFKAQYGPGWDGGNGATTYMTNSRLKLKTSTRAVENFISGTQKSLVFENENYMPITNLEAAFARLRARKVSVAGVVNEDMDDGPELFKEADEYEEGKINQQDSVGSEWVGLVSSQGSLSTAFELTPRGSTFFMHGKVAVRDNKDVFVGSFNFDGRSANINIETAAIIPSCTDLVTDVTTHYAEVYKQYEADQTQNLPKPQPSELAKILGDIILPQL